MKAVKFEKPFSLYNEGDVATFSDEQVDALVESKIAKEVELDPSVAGEGKKKKTKAEDILS